MPTTPLAPVSYEPIKAVRVLGSQAATPSLTRQLEAATQTWQVGVPLRLVSGYVQECTFSGADIVYGASAEHAHNLTTAGTAQDESEGAPQNQPNAVTTAVGAWIRDGACGSYNADSKNVFSIALKSGQVFTQALLVAGTLYGLVKDTASGFWYLDNTVTTGNGAVAELLGVDSSSPNTVAGGTRVFFQFAAAKRYFQ
jgi:hypothetical protein